jgi:hypothetical protein
MIQTNHQLHSGYILQAKHLIGARTLFSSDPNIIPTQAPVIVRESRNRKQTYKSQSFEMEFRVWRTRSRIINAFPGDQTTLRRQPRLMPTHAGRARRGN